jgi:alkane 1-monooxygenase
MHPLAYIAVYFFPLLALSALYLGGAWVAALPVLALGLIPFAELFFHGTTDNTRAESTPSPTRQRILDMLVYGLIPLQVGIVIYLPAQISTGAYAGWEVFGAILTVGVCCATFGINLGHELGHRNNRFDQTASKLLLATTLYMHFFIEHNRGHHARVATEVDPATSRRGESLYRFWLRSTVGGWLHAWELESKRLSRTVTRPMLSLKNEMVRFQFIQVGIVAAMAYAFGLAGVLAFVAAAVIGFLFLETINYIEHYGLRRSRRPDGRFEPVLPAHSWNANHSIGRALLFELTRHADHHANARRHFAQLRHHPEGPQLPTGYPGMILLALVPPVFMHVMDRQIVQEQARLAGRLAA